MARITPFVFLVGLLPFLLSPDPTWAEVSIRDPGTFVVDHAGIIGTAAERQVEGWLRELEQKTSAQIKVLTVRTIDGEDFLGFAQRHAEAWKLGQQGKDNGALIVLALQERKVRIQIGYGLEGILPDSWAGSLSRQIAGEFFKKGKYSEGVLALTVATANKVADAEHVTLTGIPNYRYQSGRGGSAGIGAGLLPLIILYFVMTSMMRRRRHSSAWGGGNMATGMILGGLLGSALGGRRSPWGGGYGTGFGGGFGGGSFGGGGGCGGGGGGASW